MRVRVRARVRARVRVRVRVRVRPDRNALLPRQRHIKQDITRHVPHHP